LRFNKKPGDTSNDTLGLSPYSQPDKFNDSNGNLVPIDILRVDEQSRLTLTKRVKQVLPFEPGDKIAIYEDKVNPNKLVCKIQHRKQIVSRLTITKHVMIGEVSGDGKGSDGVAISVTSEEQRSVSSLNVGNVKSPKHAKIILVDDDQDILYTCKTALSSYPDSKEYNIETFTDAPTALARFLEARNNSSYDLVVTDIRMHRLNGIQLYQIMKALDPSIKILFISGLDSAKEITSILPNVRLRI
jgi:CheY-like chemotaxis protein